MIDSFKEIFYAAGHTGVLYDFENNTQRLLQGHVLIFPHLKLN